MLVLCLLLLFVLSLLLVAFEYVCCDFMFVVCLLCLLACFVDLFCRVCVELVALVVCVAFLWHVLMFVFKCVYC